MQGVSPNRPRTFAVVGTTGFLGPFILAALLRKHAGSKIFCLNRSHDGKKRTLSALERIGNTISDTCTMLHFFVVDITKPNFGLEAAGEFLTSEVDEFILNAWNSNWALPLSSFAPFLTAVRVTIDLCTLSTRKSRITFISSICAIGEWPRKHTDQPLIPEDVAWDTASAMAHGYGESKCCAEQLLAQAHAVFGLHIAIMRAGQIAGPVLSTATPSTYSGQGWVGSIIKASEQIGFWPANVQLLNWIPVDTLAEGIADYTRTGLDNKVVQVFNMVHPDPAPWKLLFEVLQKEVGFRAEEISLPAWLDKLQPELVKLYDFFRVAGNGREYDMSFDTTQATKLLPNIMPITEKQVLSWVSCFSLQSNELKAKM
ncbi:hypothetical protein GQ44DRAFT_731144 [Phaeosphaeriaceae sp. PMI808]|nr:hypothetical protein GQ44DRAFT_731144 [Phaeosphaeriaceae sp. PMI808]